jgi:hypothetical protein
MKLIKNALVYKAELHEAAVQTLSLSSVITELCDMLGYKETEQEKEAV